MSGQLSPDGREDKDGKKTEFKPVLLFADTAVWGHVSQAAVLEHMMRNQKNTH